jgi:hypothetical protein
MAVISIKNKTKSGSLLVGNEPFELGDYRSIATVTVGAGGATEVEFTSIPSWYSHLQIRCILNNVNISIRMRFNGDTNTNYSDHILYGDGTSALAAGVADKNHISFTQYSVATTSTFHASVIDILDYNNTNKNKTVRSLTGSDTNGAGFVALSSGLWRNTNAITSIKWTVAGGSWTQGSSFALYGIKG